MAELRPPYRSLTRFDLATVQVDFTGFAEFQKSIRKGLVAKNKAPEPIREAFSQWGAIYRGFAQEAFSIASRGGLDWPPLKASTRRRRRKGTRKRIKTDGKVRIVPAGRVAILIDTGTLFGALSLVVRPGSGAVEKHIRNGIRVGFGGPAKHPKGKATISDIAAAHNVGVPGRLPRRTIIRKPSADTEMRMAEVLQDALARTWKRSTA